MKETSYKRLTTEERTKIEAYLALHKSKAEIARLLNRPRCTVTREINKWVRKPTDRYRATLADWYAKDDNRIKHSESKMKSNSLLRFYVFRHLIDKWSPEQISQRLKIDYPLREDLRISYESIYKYIYYQTHGRLKKRLIKLLPYTKPNRKRTSFRKSYRGHIKDPLRIDKRPKEIHLRKSLGHWEGDLVIGKDQRSAIGTLVERKTRYTLIVKMNSRKSMHVINNFADELLKFPDKLLKTLTYDNGVEMAEHKRFSNRTKMPVYFAHPYSSWERGTNENTNGLIRRFFPKKTDFNEISDTQLKRVEYLLNNRPRKVLNWKTPSEKLAELCA
jgi:IS30 family transposase